MISFSTEDLNQVSESTTSCGTQPSNLKEFLQGVHNNRLENMQLLTSLEDICGVSRKFDDQICGKTDTDVLDSFVLYGKKIRKVSVSDECYSV